MDLGQGFGNVEGKLGGGGFEMPPCTGYPFRVVDVKDTTNKKGSPMLEIYLDIAMGDYEGAFEKFPKIQYVPYGDEAGRARLKGTLDLIIGQNKAMFPEDDVFANGTFDEQRLIGCVTGGVLKWDTYNGKNYLKINYLCTPEEAQKAKVIPEPAISETAKAPAQSSGGTGNGWGFGNN